MGRCADASTTTALAEPSLSLPGSRDSKSAAATAKLAVKARKTNGRRRFIKSDLRCRALYSMDVEGSPIPPPVQGFCPLQTKVLSYRTAGEPGAGARATLQPPPTHRPLVAMTAALPGTKKPTRPAPRSAAAATSA